MSIKSLLITEEKIDDYKLLKQAQTRRKRNEFAAQMTENCQKSEVTDSEEKHRGGSLSLGHQKHTYNYCLL